MTLRPVQSGWLLAGAALAVHLAVRVALDVDARDEPAGLVSELVEAALVVVALGVLWLVWRALRSVTPLRRWGLVVLVVLSALLVWRPPAWPRSHGHGPSVVLVVVDCLRPDHLGAYGYAGGTSPALDALAAEGRLYETVYSTASWTKTSVASLITGKSPHEHGVLRSDDVLPLAQRTLAERLRDHGYRTAFFGGGNTWIGARFAFDQGYDRFEEDAGTAAQIAARFIDWLASSAPSPFFAYLHLMDVHMPYNVNRHSAALPEEVTDSPLIRPGLLDSRWVRRRQAAGLLSEHDRRRIVQLYDAQVREVDDQIARIAAALTSLGHGDDTLLIVTADHGEELWERHNFGHGHMLYEVPLRIPLVIVGPGVPPGRDRVPATLSDLAPTVLGVAGIDAGASLLSVGRRPRAMFASSTMYGREKYALIESGRKLIAYGQRQPGGNHLIGPDVEADWEYFDLQSDPGERVSRFEQGGAPLQSMLHRLEPIAARVLEGAPSSARRRPELTPSDLERLRSLGYVE